LPVTLDLLKEAAVDKHEITGDVWLVTEGRWNQENDFFENTELVIRHLRTLKEDISIAEFIRQFFAEDKYKNLRKSLASYIEGYYSGKTERSSAKAFLKEWLSEDEQQYRPLGGYGEIINYLAENCIKRGTIINLSTVVKEIKWQKGYVEVTDHFQNKFVTSKAIITVPLGVWLAAENTKGAILYSPSLQFKAEAAKQMGFGSAIKILLEFKNIFWEDESIIHQSKTDTRNLQMVLSDMPIPTWWTQLPKHTPILTGWLSGTKAEEIKNEKDEVIIGQSLYSLSNIFNIDINALTARLKFGKVFNWANDAYTLGSYSYSTGESKSARKILSEPIENTLFFAGEALYEGTETGTVEAALTNGLQVASAILWA
ncbi:MAG TPA: NAD(P)/FAD-dependent oxidoreductase, partial [Segetibacter sp.]